VAVGVFDERVSAAAGLGITVVLDPFVHQLLVVGFEFALGDPHGDVAPRVADFLDVLAVVRSEFEHRPVFVHAFGPEIDDGEVVALVALFFLVVEVGSVPVDRLLEVRDAQHYVVEDSSHTVRTSNAGSKRIPNDPHKCSCAKWSKSQIGRG